MAESFGVDVDRYDRARPHYPAELVARVVAGSPGADLVDVGCGPGALTTELVRPVRTGVALPARA